MKSMTDVQTGTVLAALRLYQEHLECGNVPPRIADIASDEHTRESLDSEEIDTLCEELNFGLVGTDDELKKTISTLVEELDAIGFADPDEPVNGADIVDLIGSKIARLRALVA